MIGTIGLSTPYSRADIIMLNEPFADLNTVGMTY
jgi:hypothetical protein